MSVILLDVQEFNLMIAVIADPRRACRLCLAQGSAQLPLGDRTYLDRNSGSGRILVVRSAGAFGFDAMLAGSPSWGIIRIG